MITAQLIIFSAVAHALRRQGASDSIAFSYAGVVGSLGPFAYPAMKLAPGFAPFDAARVLAPTAVLVAMIVHLVLVVGAWVRVRQMNTTVGGTIGFGTLALFFPEIYVATSTIKHGVKPDTAYQKKLAPVESLQ